MAVNVECTNCGAVIAVPVGGPHPGDVAAAHGYLCPRAVDDWAPVLAVAAVIVRRATLAGRDRLRTALTAAIGSVLDP